MTKVVFFGASSVEGSGASTPERRFTSILAQAMGWDEVNLGIGGTPVAGRSDDGELVDENSGIARVPDVLDAKPDLVFILYGANDFVQSVPLGDPGQFRQGTFFWDFDTLLRGLLWEVKPEQIILSTLVYRADGQTPNGQGLTLADYNKVIQELGVRHHIRVLDAATESGISQENFAALSADDAHLNDAGYARLAAFYSSALHEERSQ